MSHEAISLRMMPQEHGECLLTPSRFNHEEFSEFWGLVQSTGPSRIERSRGGVTKIVAAEPPSRCMVFNDIGPISSPADATHHVKDKGMKDLEWLSCLSDTNIMYIKWPIRDFSSGRRLIHHHVRDRGAYE